MMVRAGIDLDNLNFEGPDYTPEEYGILGNVWVNRNRLFTESDFLEETDTQKKRVSIYLRCYREFGASLVFDDIPTDTGIKRKNCCKTDYFYYKHIILGANKRAPSSVMAEITRYPDVMHFLSHLWDDTNFQRIFREYCDLRDLGLPEDLMSYIHSKIPVKYREYYELLGKDGVGKTSYRECRCQEHLKLKNPKLIEKIRGELGAGVYMSTEILEKLGKVFDEFGISRVPSIGFLKNYIKITKQRKSGTYRVR